jgi:hypothetical protein
MKIVKHPKELRHVHLDGFLKNRLPSVLWNWVAVEGETINLLVPSALKRIAAIVDEYEALTHKEVTIHYES